MAELIEPYKISDFDDIKKINKVDLDINDKKIEYEYNDINYLYSYLYVSQKEKPKSIQYRSYKKFDEKFKSRI